MPGIESSRELFAGDAGVLTHRDAQHSAVRRTVFSVASSMKTYDSYEVQERYCMLNH